MANKYVIDTHALIWYLEGNPRLGNAAKTVMDDFTSTMVLPMIGLAEAIDIVDKGRTTISDVNVLLNRVNRDNRIQIYPLTLAILKQSLAARAVPEMHDRLIVSTALHLQSIGNTVSVLTKDNSIVASALVPVIW
jgi:PIN domain nuclease of toxin-antitoxin system